MDSISDDIKAAAHLAQSKRAQRIAIGVAWLATLAASGVGGWVARTFDLRHDLADLRTAIDGVARSQEKLAGELHVTDADHPGFILQTQRDITAVAREVVFVGGAALAYESERTTKAKLEAGADLTKAFDQRMSDGERPATAVRVALTTVAVPHTR